MNTLTLAPAGRKRSRPMSCNADRAPSGTFCRRTRREFLWETGAGFTGLALTGLLAGDGFFPSAVASPTGNPLAPRAAPRPARARSVIFLFMYGGPSQV